MAQYELNLRDYFRVLRKRKLIVIFAAISLGFFSFLFATLQKPIPLYRAVSSVKVEKSHTKAGLYLDASYEQSINLDTQTAIIRSIPIMEFVAKRLGLIDEQLTPQEIRKNAQYINRVLGIKNQIGTSIEGYTNIINIEAIDKDPKFAQDLANTIAEVYKEQNALEKNKRLIESKKYIEHQLVVVGDRLKTAQENLRTFREKNRLVTIESQTSEILRSLNDSEKEYINTRREKNEIVALFDELGRQKEVPKEKVEGFYAEKVGTIFSSLNTKLVDLYTQRNLMLMDYNKNHPEILRMDAQIDKVIGNMQNHLNDQVKRLSEKENFLAGQIEKTKEKFNALPSLGFELEKIEHELKINKDLHAKLKEKYQETQISEAEREDEVSIVRPALIPRAPINPPTTVRTAAIGTLVGFILGLVIAFVFETIDTSIGTIEDVEELLGVPVLGIVPFIRPEEIEETLIAKTGIEIEGEMPERYSRLITHFSPKSTIAESFRTMRTSLKFMCLEKGVKTILFSSSSPGEGKSTTSVNLAIVFAQIGNKTLLVDADLRKPVVARIFGIDREPGLSDVILGNYEWKELVRTVTDLMMGKMSMEEIMLTPGFDNLNIITCGSIPSNPSEILNSQRMTEFIHQVKDAYDVIIIDTAPILMTTDAAILGSKVDGVVLTYRVGQVARGALKRAKVQMDHIKANMLGVVLNGLKPEVSADYQMYGYARYYSYGGEHKEQLPWRKRMVEKAKALASKSTWEKMVQRGWLAQGYEKSHPFLAYCKKGISWAKELAGKISPRWVWWLKMLLLALSSLVLVIGLLWQFEIIRTSG